ncbi:putative helicase mov-10-B.1 [Scomber scombrus]|uniref:Helicase mov-10-B.1 n=1 Tax=Scomber scombrus TaxID=13677 RepID=A0AAV1MXX1_SCOSC
MVQMSLYLRCRVGLEFFEFLNESDRAFITDRDELKDIYNDEFKNKEAREPNFGSVLYALKHANKTTRGDTIHFSPKVIFQYLDQWALFRDHQPGWIQNGEARPMLEEAVSRVRARRKLANILINRLKTDRAQLIADKHGVSIKSDHQFEDGNISFRTDSANEYVVNLTVKNTGTKPVYFTYYTPLRWLRHFFLNDENHVTRTNPLTLKPGDGYKIQVRFHCSLLGFDISKNRHLI